MPRLEKLTLDHAECPAPPHLLNRQRDGPWPLRQREDASWSGSWLVDNGHLRTFNRLVFQWGRGYFHIARIWVEGVPVDSSVPQQVDLPINGALLHFGGSSSLHQTNLRCNWTG